MKLITLQKGHVITFCRRHLTNFLLNLYRILSFYSFFFPDIYIWFLLVFFGEKRHSAGHLFIKTLKFSKFIADISIAQKIQNFNNLTPFLNPEFDSLTTSWLFSDENIINGISAAQKMK